MTKLNASQTSALNQISKAKQLLEETKRRKRADFEEHLKDSTANLVEDIERLALNADLMGIPRTQIGKSMGTTNYRTVQELLEGARAKFSVNETEGPRLVEDFSVTPVNGGKIITLNSIQNGGSFIVNDSQDGYRFSDGDQVAFLMCRDSGLLRRIWEDSRF